MTCFGPSWVLGIRHLGAYLLVFDAASRELALSKGCRCASAGHSQLVAVLAGPLRCICR